MALGVSPKAFHEKHTNRKVGFFVKKYKITFFERSSTLRFLRFLQEALGETEGANRKVGIVLRASYFTPLTIESAATIGIINKEEQNTLRS